MKSLLITFGALSLVVTLVWITESHAGDIVFPPLPKGQKYKLKEVPASKRWILEGLNFVAKRSAFVVKQEPPYDIIDGIINQAEGKRDSSLTVKKVLDYEKPIIALGALSLVFAVVLPIIGIVLCCCRRKNRCGGHLDDTKMKRYPCKERLCYSISLFLCSLLLIIWGSFILVSSCKMSHSVPAVRKVLSNSFDDITTYKNNTFQELNHLAGDDLMLSLATFLKQVKNLTQDVVQPVLVKGQSKLESLTTSVFSVAVAVEKASQDLIEIEKTVARLVQEGEDVSAKLQEAKQNITESKKKCNLVPTCSSNVTIPTVTDLEMAANFSKVPNVTETRKRVEKVVQSNLTEETNKGRTSFRDIPKKVNNLVTDFTAKFDNFTKNTENVKLDVLRPYENNVDEYFKKYVMPQKSKVDKYLAPDGVVNKYDGYRHIVFILSGVLVLFSGLLVLAGVVMGMTGASRYDTPATRNQITHIGGKVILWSAWLLFALVFIVNLLTGVTFILGTNASVVCHSLSNLKLIEKTVDNPDKMEGYPFARMLFKNSSVKITLSGILRGCENNESPWTALQMDRIFNLSDVLNYKEKLPVFDEVFSKLNKTVSGTMVLTDRAGKELNNSRDAGVDKINFTQYEEQLNQPIVKVNISEVVSQLRKAAKEASSHSIIAAELNSTGDELEQVQRQKVSSSEQNVRRLENHVTNLRQEGIQIVNGVQSVSRNLGELKRFLEQDALLIVNKAALKHWKEIFHTVDGFLLLVVSKLRGEVGKCKPLRNIYDQATYSVCEGYFAGLNGAWVSFGLCSLTTLITIILCVRASKYFMLASGNSSLDSITIAEDLELPWGDTVRLGPMKESNLKYQSTPIGYNAFAQSS